MMENGTVGFLNSRTFNSQTEMKLGGKILTWVVKQCTTH